MAGGYYKLLSLVESAEKDYNLATSGNKAATTRVRKTMQGIKQLCQEIRQEMLALRDKG